MRFVTLAAAIGLSTVLSAPVQADVVYDWLPSSTTVSPAIVLPPPGSPFSITFSDAAVASGSFSLSLSCVPSPTPDRLPISCSGSGGDPSQVQITPHFGFAFAVTPTTPGLTFFLENVFVTFDPDGTLSGSIQWAEQAISTANISVFSQFGSSMWAGTYANDAATYRTTGQWQQESSVPEPGTLALLLTAFFAFGGALRWKNQ